MAEIGGALRTALNLARPLTRARALLTLETKDLRLELLIEPTLAADATAQTALEATIRNLEEVLALLKATHERCAPQGTVS